ncbi:FAD-binding domain-containing protein [Mycena galericulata]|nr:FAD-binding domain-containing protein [Mycena galericulata]
MKSFTTALVLLFSASSAPLLAARANLNLGSPACRNIPGSAGYPGPAAWRAFNSTISGRLVNVVPSAKFCESLPSGECTEEQWTSFVFRNTIPGAMNQVNWEQGYDLAPPSLCLQNGTTCGQGDVPLYSVEAETVADIQAALEFTRKNNLRLVVKSSGHDVLGRSTAPGALLIRTSKFQNISFTDSFLVGTQDVGATITVGSGVHSQMVYQTGKAHGRIAVSGPAATVCTGAGYVQGAGHSALSPTFGLGADNALEFDVVVAHGELLKVNNVSHPDLFYALRGGGSGSWGIIVATTFRTYPTFNTTTSTIILGAANNTVAADLAVVHAQHIFDMDEERAGQYFFHLKNTSADIGSVMVLFTHMPHLTPDEAKALQAPFLNASLALPGVSLISEEYVESDVNDAMFRADDSVGLNAAAGSRLIPATTYRDDPALIGEVYQELLDSGTTIILGHLVAGGQVAANANISSAVHPAWRTAKTHLVFVNAWTDAASLEEIDITRKFFQSTQVPILAKIAGPNPASYSNEADVLEPDFQTTFFGPNYAKLSAIKSVYDPEDLFIVGAGVGSERWDEWGICRV